MRPVEVWITSSFASHFAKGVSGISWHLDAWCLAVTKLFRGRIFREVLRGLQRINLKLCPIVPVILIHDNDCDIALLFTRSVIIVAPTGSIAEGVLDGKIELIDLVVAIFNPHCCSISLAMKAFWCSGLGVIALAGVGRSRDLH